MNRFPRISFTWTLLAIALFAAFFELGRSDVVTANEGQRTTPPAEMLRSGQYIVPTINGVDYLAKPPMLYWMIAGVYKATGSVSEFAARVPSAASTVLLVLCLYWLARRETSEHEARWAALALLTAPFLLDRSHLAEIDVVLSLAVFLCLMAMRGACRAESAGARAGLALAGGLAIGAATLLKGPPPYLMVFTCWIAIQIVEGPDSSQALRAGGKWTLAAFIPHLAIWPIVMLLMYLQYVAKLDVTPWLDMAQWASRTWHRIALALYLASWLYLAFRYGPKGRRLSNLGALLIVALAGLATAAPWGLALLRARGWAYIDGLLHTEVIERTYEASRINGGSPLFYAYNLLAMMAPWGLLLPFHASRTQWREGSPIYRFGVLGGWLTVGAFSLIAGKEREYILPIMSLLALSTGILISRIASGELRGWMASWARIWLPAMTALMAALVIGIAIYYTVAEQSILLWVEMWTLALAAFGAAAIWRAGAQKRLARLCALSLVVIIMYITGRGYHFSLNQENTPKPLADICRSLIDNGYTLETTPRLHSTQPFPYPYFSFYLERNIPFETNADAVAAKLNGSAPYFYLTHKDMLKFMPKALESGKAHVVYGPCTSRKLLLVSNTELPKDLLRGE